MLNKELLMVAKLLTKGPALVRVDHGDHDVGQDVGWKSFLM